MRREAVQIPADVVDAGHERPQRRVVDDADGARVDAQPLELVAALAERVDQLLDEARGTRTGGEEIPESAAASLADTDPLDAPITEEFRVGAMALGWDEASRRVVLEAHAVSEEDVEIPDIADDGPEGPDTLRVWITPAYARAFAERARQVVSAGRPPCPFCSQPLDPEGHICPRANGYRRRG